MRRSARPRVVRVAPGMPSLRDGMGLERRGRELSDRYHAWNPEPCSTTVDVARAKLPESTCWLLGRARGTFT